MDPDRPVEISFGGACCHCNADRLHHLSGIVTDHVGAHHKLARLIHHQLHHRPPVPPAHRVPHRQELRDIDIRRPVLGRLLLAQSACPDRRHGKHRRRDRLEGPRAGMRAEQPVRQMMPFRDRHRRQIHLIRDIADRVNM